MRQEPTSVPGPQRVFPRKVQPWPSRVVVLEPEWETEEVKPGLYRMVARGWFMEQLSSSLSLLPGGGFVSGSSRLCSQLCAMAHEHGRILVVGHGMANILVLLGASEWFRSAGFLAENYFAVKSRAFVRIVAKGAEIIFCDVRNWLHGDQCEYGEWAGCPVEPFFRFWPGEELTDGYHCRVVAGIVYGLQKYRTWIQENGLGDFSYSLSSMTWGHWSRQEESRKVRKSPTIIHEECERNAHHGGFVKAHKIGHFTGGPFYLLDANGLYSWVMATHKLPWGHFTTAWNPEPHWHRMVEREGEALVHGVFEVDSAFLPVSNGPFVQWEHGPVETWLPWPEFCFVRDHGRIHKVKTIMVFKTDFVTRDTIGSMLERRFACKRAGRKYESTLWKLATNSLYGKTAQRFGPVDCEPIADDEEDSVEWIVDSATGRIVRVICWCGTRISSLENGGGHTHFPKLAAWITSWARVYLWEWCLLAGWENVLYNDTDCLLVNADGHRRLRGQIADDEPGWLKVECSGQSCEVRGRKQYSVGDRIVDNTQPNHFYQDGDGRLFWVERDSIAGRETRLDSAMVLRRRYTHTWDSVGRGWTRQEVEV